MKQQATNILKDETGNRYGKLTVISRAENTKGGQARWLCKCDCGEETIVAGNHLRMGSIVSCGCHHKDGLHRTHGLSNSRLYSIWNNMHTRCTNKKATEYKNYGGRGITMCGEWKKFESFFAWAMSSGYSDSLSIERIDVNKGYCPENCKWIPPEEQANNKTTSKFIVANNKKMTVAQWAKELNCSPYTLYHRKRSGWSDDEIVSIPCCKKNQFYRIKK